MGYIEETGAAQHLRDARITTIYEGTTAIQANDLVNRKILRDGGVAIRALLADTQALAGGLAAAADPTARAVGERLAEATAAALRAVLHLIESAPRDPRLPAAAAGPVLDLIGGVVGGRMHALAVGIALARIAEGADHDGFYAGRLATALFYAEHVLPHAAAFEHAATVGAATVMTVADPQM
jgi:hypothetical protein